MTGSPASALSLSMLTVVAVLLTCCSAGSATTPTAAVVVTPQTQRVPVEGGGSYTDLSAVGLAAMLEAKGFSLINVHIPYAGEIDGTDLFIPYNEIEANLEKLPADKAAKLVLYCRSGGMSAIAARTLVKLGYTNVWDLNGGMIAWREAGHSITDRGQ